MDWLLAALALTAWFTSSRLLFRRWVRADTFSVPDAACRHGYTILHEDEPCHGSHPVRKGQVATFAMLASLVWPIVLVVAAVMHNAPQGRAEMAQKTAELEKENARLRRMLGN
jgi:hypothetical protein